MTSPVPVLTLNSGVQMPAIGLGVFQTPPEETTAAVEAALAAGYRHIDTAAAYMNEREAGEGIRRSGIDRSEIFIETKVWISDYGYDQTLHAFDKAAGKLGTSQIDLLILHQPLPSAFDRTIAAYKALEQLLADGKVRAIGVSNFMPDHLTQLLEATGIVPAVNQIELHPYFTQPGVQKADAEHGILTQAWSPIGGITFYRGSGKSTLQDPAILAIASAHGRTAAQVMLRWHLQRGRSVIPKSVRPDRIAENFDVLGFDLTPDELDTVDALDAGVRGGPEPASITLENFGRPGQPPRRAGHPAPLPRRLELHAAPRAGRQDCHRSGHRTPPAVRRHPAPPPPDAPHDPGLTGMTRRQLDDMISTLTPVPAAQREQTLYVRIRKSCG